MYQDSKSSTLSSVSDDILHNSVSNLYAPVRVRMRAGVRVWMRLKISQHHHWYAHSHSTSRIVHRAAVTYSFLVSGADAARKNTVKLHTFISKCEHLHPSIPHLPKRRSATLQRKPGALVPVPLSSSPQQLVEQVGMIRLCAYTVMRSLVAR